MTIRTAQWVCIGLLVLLYVMSSGGVRFLGGEAASVEVPHHPPKPPMTVLLKVVPDAHRACSRAFAAHPRACAAGVVITMESPCNYPREVYARRQCHELKHVEDYLLKRPPWHGSDGRARD